MSMALKYKMMKKAKAGGSPCDEHGKMNCMDCGGMAKDDDEAAMPGEVAAGSYAEGGKVTDSPLDDKYWNGSFKLPSYKERRKTEEEAKRKQAEREHEKTQASKRRMDPVYKAEGGMVDDDRDMELVDRIMKKRKGEPVADFEQNDFDVSDENPPEEFSYTGANSGDELGNEAMDENDQDLIRRIMRSRAKKDKMPRPA